jgi:nitric oxide reductase subunit B
MALLDIWSLRGHGKPYAELSKAGQIVLEARLREALRRNRYNPGTGTITVSDDRATAIANIIPYYDGLFGDDPAFAQLRETYAMKDGTVDTAEHRRQMTAFFFWTAWAAVTSRPGQEVSYTNNWPYEPLVGNEATASSFLWSMFSILFMLAGIALLAWHYAAYHGKESPLEPPPRDPLLDLKITSSMLATAKFFWLVVALFLVQILLGAITAHYQVEKDFYGVNISEVLPYSLTRSWHTQLAVLWIATAWLGTGLYIGPAVSGHEPKVQRLGVNFLFTCLLVIVVGAFIGQWLAVMQKLGLEYNFWFGHQGWEYTDIGRFWQAFLFIGLILWLTLVGRAVCSAHSTTSTGPGPQRQYWPSGPRFPRWRSFRSP